MKADKTPSENDLSSIPGDFRENYRFLSELINCKHKNDELTCTLGTLFDERLPLLTKKITKRQLRILKQFLEYTQCDDDDIMIPPVPVELEAAIRVKKRSHWLPWESEAIRKIETWRKDVDAIKTTWQTISKQTGVCVSLSDRM